MSTRINKFVAQAAGLGRRKADELVASGQITVNGSPVSLGYQVEPKDQVELNGKLLQPAVNKTLLLLNKPAGYVCSRDGQGSTTIYDLLPDNYHNLKSIGRLDKDSRGLLLMTDDGYMANQLTHPSYGKTKVYQVGLNKDLLEQDRQQIEAGVILEDGPSHLKMQRLANASHWQVSMQEGRNRQIRRTFEQQGYQVTDLMRTNFGQYSLNGLEEGQYKLA